MQERFSEKYDSLNILVAFIVSLIVFIVYVLTKAPTVSFWDCGEFVACSYILGIPHPPGTPLYIIIGRLFSLLPLAADIAARINFLSVICSTLTALFGYLIGVRILRLWFDESQSGYGRFLTYAGGACGAFFLAWGYTNWNNSIEAEVYGMSMMLMTLIVWLVMIFMEKRGTGRTDKIMALVIYLCFLGIGVHMTTFLALAFAALVFVLKKDTVSWVWYAVAVFIGMELYLIFAVSSMPGEIPYYVPVVIVFVLFLFYIFSVERVPSLFLFTGAGLLLSVAPLFGFMVNSFRGGGEADRFLSENILNTLTIIGQTAFVVLFLFGLFLLYRFLTLRKKGKDAGQYSTSFAFIFAAVVLTGLLYTFKGYAAFLVISAILLVLFLFMIRRFVHWPILAAIAGVSLVVVEMEYFLYGIIGASLIILVMGLGYKTPQWKNGLVIILMAVMGFSIHLFIPIRSAQQPFINENNPSQDLKTMVNFLERKQYGAQSMVERMFKRRAEWENQFGMYHRMGFWNFFSKQYGLTGPKFIVFFLIGIFGIWEVIRRRASIGLPLLILLLICSVGLVLYMNFADGTRQNPVTSRDYIEVRDRDYFFTPAFIFFGMMIGVGISVAIRYIRDMVKNFGVIPRKVILTSSIVLFLLPVYPLANNYYYCNRSNNYFPYNYAWNLLSSAEKDAVLFTYGDNDTFPLWAVQTALGVRPDIKLVNLSLTNTKWYIKQLQTTLNLELGWTESDIDRLRPFRTSDGATYRLQDLVIDAIITNNYPGRPVNFSVTIPTSSRRFRGKSIDERLTLSGLTWHLKEDGNNKRIDLETSYDYFTDPEKFQGGGLDDPSIFKDETILRLSGNYANSMLMVAEELQRNDELEKAEELVLKTLRLVPHDDRTFGTLASIYAKQGKLEELRSLVNTTTEGDRPWMNTMLGRLEIEKGDPLEGEKILNGILVQNPNFRPALKDLMRYYYETKNIYSMKVLLQRWLQFNPDDEEIRSLQLEIQEGLSKNTGT